MPWTKVGSLTPPTNTVTPVEPYVRPVDWLPLPAVNVGEQKVVGLYAVFPYDGANLVAVSCAGAYTVDWGDGTAPENYATGVQADHLYTYASLPAGTGTTRGYRQAIATITPQSGQTLTVVNLGRKHAQVTSTVPSTGWLDVCMAGASVTSLVLGTNTGQTALVNPGSLEQLEYKGPSAITNISYLFTNCYNLQSIKGAQFTANATVATGFINGCNALRTLADLNLSKITATTLFASNVTLQRIAGINLSTATSAVNMFNGCTALVEIADLNLAAATAAPSMFTGCTSLRTATSINMPIATSVSGMFSGCTNLTTVTGLTTANVTQFDNMFNNCLSLRVGPSFDTSRADSFSSVFSGCVALQRVPVYNLVKGIYFTNTFLNCKSLTEIPAWDMAAATADTTGFVSNCTSLSSVGITGLKVSISFSGCRLSSAALDALYTQLGTGTGKTITVTGNYGTTGDTPSIATAKGWTVTGS